MKLKTKRLLGILLSLALMLGLMQGMSLTAYAASSGSNGGFNWTLDDDGKMTVTGSGALPEYFINDNGNIKSIVFDENCQVSGLAQDSIYWANNATEIIINSTADLTIAGSAIWYSSSGGDPVSITINAPKVTIAGSESFFAYDRQLNITVNTNELIVYNGTMSYLGQWNNSNNSFAYPANSTVYIPAGYVFTESFMQREYDEMVQHGNEDMFWQMNGERLEQGRDYTYNAEASSVALTSENAGTVFGGAQTSSSNAYTAAHNHSFTYSASGATITATCGGTGICDITEGLTLTISAPTGDLTTDGTKTFPATLSTGYNTTAFPGTYAITYTKDGAEFTGTPTEAGEYTASVTVGTATANVSYTVYASKDTQTITASDVTATYGDTGKKIEASTTGDGGLSYAVKSGDAVTVDASGNLTIVKAGSAVITVTAAETDTYTQATKDVNVTVNTKAMTVSAEDVNVTVDGQPHGITVNVTDPATGYTIKYGTEAGSYTLDASPTQTEVGEKAVYYQVTADNYTTYTGSAKVTVSAKQTQTITAENVTAAYGDTGKSIEASTSGDGTLSYAVKSGDAVTVNETTGALTIVKAGSAVITVTASETDTYAQATKEVTVTINKANAVAATVTANNRTYDGTEKSLVTVTGEPMGDTMYYALGENSTTAPADNLYTTSIPAKTDAGTYYVWYMAKGDSNHSDSVPVVVTVTIEKKSIADATVTLDKETLEYTGSEQTVSVTGVKIGDTALVAGTDYEVEGTTKATDAGEYTVKVNGKGNYTNSATADWKILADDEISYTVTFKVVNGSWNDGTAADRTVQLSGVASEALKLSADKIPTVGSKPAAGYKEGSWDVVPSAETAITEDVTYTYTYAKEETVDTVSHTVTFKVVNGSWNDGTAADRTVQLSGVASEALKLSADKIPTVGSKPADGYKEGSWDVVPSAETAITEDVTYTYTYAVTETKIDVKVEEKEDTPAMTVDGLTKELVGNVATEEEQAAINNGENAVMSLEVTNIDQSVSASDKQIMEGAAVAAAPNAQVGMYLDLSMILKVGNRSPRKVTDLSGNSIKAEITVPEKLRAPAGVKRMFYLMSIHNNIPKVLGKSTTFKIPVTLTEFSTYAIVYADEVLKAEGFNTSIKIKQANGKLVISWDKVEGVKKVDVFLTYCGNEYPSKAVKSTSGNSVTIKKLKGKKLNLKKNLKVYLAAYDSNGNKIGKSISAHFAGKDHKKYTNAKSIKLSDTSVSIAKGGSKKIKATIKLEDKSKKRTSEDHAKAFRYRSTIPGIATVDQDGNIKGVSAGTCEVYVYAQNGLAKKVAVTVTD
ncbi:Ig-like domain-containing protein [Butyrivibrio sp. VCD2006]|uniref:Ig-like domain-containing protein n=1 Tax=Butyrivibrio sp. VCD2006 TaxID=1280664 RepID=UPI0003F7D441|nr:Ig-like domain-containing protein [Butyrivibrio sp. VCD2006]